MFDTGSRSQILPSLVLGFHGSDEETAEQVLAGKAHLEDTTNDYDRLGHGIYFREYSRQRAYEFAHKKKRRGEIDSVAVIHMVHTIREQFTEPPSPHCDTVRGAFWEGKEQYPKPDSRKKPGAALRAEYGLHQGLLPPAQALT